MYTSNGKQILLPPKAGTGLVDYVISLHISKRKVPLSIVTRCHQFI
jgi:hypothetical protein